MPEQVNVTPNDRQRHEPLDKGKFAPHLRVVFPGCPLWMEGESKPFKSPSFKQVLYECGMASEYVAEVKGLSDVDFDNCDVLVIPQGMVSMWGISSEDARRIRDFVAEGGICWIVHQFAQGWNPDWLPPHLSDVKLMNRYVPMPVFSDMEYVGPWIIERDHPIWHKPNYLDEGHFTFWKIWDKWWKWRTTATSVVWRQKGWKVIAKFADPAVRVEEDGALVMQAEHGRGLYFWTQMFSPRLVWEKEGFEKRTWRLFLENILTFFEDHKGGKLLSLKVEVHPWSLRAGEEVKIRVELGRKARRVKMEVNSPEGREEIQVQREDNRIYLGAYEPKAGGEHSVEITAWAEDRATATNHAFFKVTEGWTPYRFLTHTHCLHEWCPESPGLIFGACRRLGIDAVVTAMVERDNYRPEDLALVDNPRTRFFFGEEFHPNHRYTPEEGCPPENPGCNRHFVTFGTEAFRDYGDLYDREDLEWVHQQGGLAIVAHPYMDRWWMKEPFDAIAFDVTDVRDWDEKLRKGEFIPGVSGRENQGIWRLLNYGPNIAWMDEPLSQKSLFKAIVEGRVTKIEGGPGSFLWFDVEGQVVGGKVYAADRVELHLKLRSLPIPLEDWVAQHLKLKSCPNKLVEVVKGGRLWRRMELERETLEVRLEDRVDEDTYYRVQLRDEEDPPYRVPSLTNPIFVEKVAGPSGGCFWTKSEGGPRFDPEKGRWIPVRTEVRNATYDGRCWKIDLYEPARGMLYAKVPFEGRVELDGMPVGCVPAGMMEAIRIGKGEHRVEIFAQ